MIRELDVNWKKKLKHKNAIAHSVQSESKICEGSWKCVILTFAGLLGSIKEVIVVQGLKSHAVTMFEVGKLNDESLDSFLTELGKVN